MKMALSTEKVLSLLEANYGNMDSTSEIAMLEDEFLSGRNPLAFLPLCQKLRRLKKPLKAMEICRRGLEEVPGSLAGKIMYVRLLADLGHYKAALDEIEKVEQTAPETIGLLIEKARCQVKLSKLDEARILINRLNSYDPMNAEVQVISRELRHQERKVNEGKVPERPLFFPPPKRNNQEILEIVKKEIQKLVSVRSCAVIPTGIGIPAVEGDPAHAEIAYEYYKGIVTSCNDLELGKMKMGVIEMDMAQFIVLVRQKSLVSVSFEPTPQFGRVFNRFQTIVEHLVPVQDAA